MDKHPSYAVLAPWIRKYPQSSGSLFQCFNDVVYAQGWADVEVLDIDKCTRAAIKGRKKDTNLYLYAVPCALSENLSTQLLNDAFAHLGSPSEFYLGITSEDASIVYYKISPGIVKPPM